MNTPKCSECQDRLRELYCGDRRYIEFCTNPDAKPKDRAYRVIGRGRTYNEDPASVKTCPRWCPRRKEVHKC